MQINQFHSGTTVGDAITNQMLMIRSLLISKGYESEIYAEYIDERLKDQVKPIAEYQGSKENILFVHHSMGMNCFEKIISLPDKKSLIYHNITPEYFFEDEGTKLAIRKGLWQAKEYNKYVDYAVADSNYNRKELLKMGYKDVDVMPIQISLDRFDHITADEAVKRNADSYKNFLFVGRVVPNKRQDDLIRSFAVYHNYFNKNSRLYLVGDDGITSYVEELQEICEEYKLEDSVTFTGKVSEEALKAYYEMADLFVCMSEHEGFGVPILEAMRMGLPVISFHSSAVPETMGGAGIVVTEKNYALIGALCNEVLENKELYNKLVERQKLRIERLEATDSEKMLFEIIEKIQKGNRKRNIQLQGPFETSYSLAIVNRKLIEAMDKIDSEENYSIYCTEGPGDYEPKEADLIDKPHAKELWEKSKEVNFPDVTIRNMYPPRVNDVNGALNFQAFGWEESIIPEEYINNFNKYLSGIGTMSDYVTNILIENGIKIPVKTMRIGVELVPGFEKLVPYKLTSNKKTKFLHISSAFPRKGVDVLLKGYFEAFTAKDDVCLVLKTFPNPHNKVEDLLKELREQYPDAPEVEWINQDLSNEDLSSLYKAADCYVQVARGEGFGLPVAEAMLAKIPVIVSANSGMADFCNDETALLVGYEQAPANTHVNAGGTKISMWFEPKKEELVSQLRKFYFERETLDLESKLEKAHDLIATEFSWKAVAKRWLAFIDEIREKQYAPRVSMVTSWNSKCGIAEYTKMEVEASAHNVQYRIYPDSASDLLFRDQPYVAKRVWENAFEGNLDELTRVLSVDSSDIVHFQFNFGFFRLENLAKTIEKLHDKKKIVITFHKTDDAIVGANTVSLRSIAPQLNLCTSLIVHQESDRQNLIDFGVKESLICIIRLGQIVYPYVSSEFAKNDVGITSNHVIGSYGFLLPHKGIMEIIQAVALLKEKYSDILFLSVCSLHDSIESKEYLKECEAEIRRLHLESNVKMITDYLQNDDSMKYLQACDMLITPYKPTGESASGAVRFCLAARRPLITTKQPIFKEFSKCSYQIDETDKNQIARAVELLAEDKELKDKCIQEINKYIEETSWHATADKFYQLYTGI